MYSPRSDEPIYLFSGLNGWLGQTAFRSLIETGLVKKSQIYNLARPEQSGSFEILKNSVIDTYIPMAFPPRDKFNMMGEALYELTCQSLLNRDIEVIRNNSIENLILISSGEVSNMRRTDELDYKRYASGKKRQEEIFAELCEKTGINLTICRVYSVTSRNITNFDSFAFANFVKSALLGDDINIKSQRLVYRKYVDFEQLFEALFRTRNLQKSRFLESSGELIEIRELAKLIVNSLNSNSRISCKEPVEDPEEYFSNSLQDYTLMKKLGINPLKLNQQLRNVVEAFTFPHVS